jgi:tetratricopeptide (TPR) repeat protein
MQDIFGIDFYGKQEIISRHAICDACRKLTVLCSYTTGRFLHFRQFPLVPLGKVHIIDECPHCGSRGITSNRKYKKQRSKDLATMMDGFTTQADNPDTALHGLHTLMVYNEESWFMDVEQSYGRRFADHMQIQLVIAQGLCRFGHYDKAETYCRKAIVQGAGPRADELLARCQSLHETSDSNQTGTLYIRPESMLRPYGFLIAVTASLFIALVASGISAMRNHTAWLVNGSPRSYSVKIDGTRYRLEGYGLKRIKLRLGKHQMEMEGLDWRKAPVLFSYKTSLLKQKFSNHALVLNPDAMAVIVTETLIDGELTNSYRFGEAINTLTGIDHPFSSFPVWAGRKHSAQSRLYNHVSKTHADVLELLRTENGESVASEYARRALLTDPDNNETLLLLKEAVKNIPTEQALSFLQHRNRYSPPRLDWHVFYQNFMKAHRPEHDLQTEYALLCETHPDSSECYYLLGLVAQNRASAKLLFEKSERGPGCHGLGYQAIAKIQLCAGEFPSARKYSKMALQQASTNTSLKALNTQILLATRDYDQLIQPIREMRANDPYNGMLASQEIQYLTLLGEHQQAIDIISHFQPAEINDPILWGDYFNAMRFYAVGNTTDYLENLETSGAPNADLQQLLHAGNIDEAHQLLGQSKDHDYTAHLILYCAAQKYENPVIAKTHLEQAIADSAIESRQRCLVSSLLSSPKAPSTQQLMELEIWATEKAVLCAAMGFKFPEHRNDFFRLAQKFNYIPEHPQLLLKKWTQLSALPQ